MGQMWIMQFTVTAKGPSCINNKLFFNFLRRIPDLYQLLMMIFLFFYVVSYHSRLVEITSRLDFLWKKQAEHELQDMKETRTYNSQLLRNILPDHVAMHFLAAEERRHEVSEFFFRIRQVLQETGSRNSILQLAFSHDL